MHLTTFQWIAASIIGILSVARTARLLVWDDYPPTVWLRIKWDDLTHKSEWNKLFHCQFCLSPYLAAGMIAWAWLAGIDDSSASSVIWWVANGWWAGSYLAASYVAYDQPDE